MQLPLKLMIWIPTQKMELYWMRNEVAVTAEPIKIFPDIFMI